MPAPIGIGFFGAGVLRQAFAWVLGIIGPVAMRALVFLGFGVTTFTGTMELLDWARTTMITQMSGLPSDLLSVASYLKVDIAFNMIFTATAARLALTGVSNVINKFGYVGKPTPKT
jgi:hypothetical protein